MQYEAPAVTTIEELEGSLLCKGKSGPVICADP